MEPRSDVRLTRTKPRFVRGVVIGDTDLTATELTNIETVANLDAEDLEALASSADVLTAIGTYEGAADIATDLAAVVSTVGNAEAGLVSDVAALEASVDTANTGLLDRTTALETTVDTAETGLLDRATALETAIGTYAGAADIATDLAAVYASVETASTGLLDRTTALETTVDTASTGLLDRTTALETAVGTYEGAANIATDLASAKENVDSMLTVLRSEYSEDTSVDTTYVYSDTPTADVVAVVTADSTAATITPGGATAWALTFTLPTANNSDTNVFRVDYDLGTHTGTVTIGGVVVTGSGVLHFFWNGTAYVTWTANAYAITLSDNSAGILVQIEDGDAANAITVTLPTSVNNVSRTLVVVVNLTADAGTACTLNLAGNFLTAAGPSTNVTNVANGVYVLHCLDSNTWVPVACTAITTNA